MLQFPWLQNVLAYIIISSHTYILMSFYFDKIRGKKAVLREIEGKALKQQ